MAKKFHILYRTECLITNKFYIGVHSTDNINDGYLGSGLILKRSILKYGKDKHIRTIISLFNNRAELLKEEKNIVNKTIISNPLCMNILVGGGSNKADFSKETRMRMSEARKGKESPFKGKKLSKESRRKISKSLENNTNRIGKYHSEESKLKMSKSTLGQVGPMNGKTQSKESRYKMSIAKRNISDETRSKMSESAKKRVVSKETKAKLSLAAKKQWAKYRNKNN